MNERKEESDWKLKLRYGKLETPFSHFTVLAEGRMTNVDNDFDCPIGDAWMIIKTWATDADESGHMLQVIGEKIGFHTTGKIEVYETDPAEPPRDNPFGYAINFTPFGDDA